MSADHVWDLAVRKPLFPLPEHEEGDAILSITFDPDSRRVWSLSDVRALRSCDVPAPGAGDATTIALQTNLETGLEIDDGGSLRIMDLASWRRLRDRLPKK